MVKTQFELEYLSFTEVEKGEGMIMADGRRDSLEESVRLVALKLSYGPSEMASISTTSYNSKSYL